MGRFEEIAKLVDLVASSRIHELTAQVDGRRITITGGVPTRSTASPPARAKAKKVPAETAAAQIAPQPETHRISAPMVGVFHHADPPITPGMRVEPGHVIAVIESMKLMNDIRSEEGGIIQSVLVDDGLAVEYGQPLFEIEPIVPEESLDEA